jgi:hypothetical protein
MDWGWYLLPLVLVAALAINLVEAGTWAAWNIMRRSSNERPRQRAERLQRWRLRNVVPDRDD